MPMTALYTAATEFRRVLATNATASAAVARTDVTAAPTTTATGGETAGGFVDLKAGQLPDYTPNTVLLKFYGAGADNTTGNCRVYGVRPVRGSAGSVLAWTHVLLAQYAFTLSTDVGVAGGVVTASDRYADTITRTAGIENVSDQMLSPTGDVSGHVLVDCKGHSLLLVEVWVGTATSVNALYAGV